MTEKLNSDEAGPDSSDKKHRFKYILRVMVKLLEVTGSPVSRLALSSTSLAVSYLGGSYCSWASLAIIESLSQMVESKICKRRATYFH